MQRIAALREQILTLRYSAYFDYGTYGPVPDSVLASMFNAWEHLHRVGPSSEESAAWCEDQLESARQTVANELRALPEQVAFGPSISALVNAVVWGLEWQRGDHIVVSAAEHAAIHAAVANLGSRLGVDVTRWDGARLPAGEMLESLVDTLRASTRLLLLSHVLWSTGETLPVRHIVRLCHERTIGQPVAVLINGAQSFGAIPSSAGELLADYFVGTLHKWCCGPDALAVLFARDPDSLQPTFAGWRSVDEHGRPHRHLRKLESGAASYAAYAGLREALLLHNRTAPETERLLLLQRNQRHLRRGLEDLASQNPEIEVLTPADAGSGILSFRLRSGAHRELAGSLEAAGVLVRPVADPACIRVCTHYFTTEPEIGLLLEAVEGFLRQFPRV